MSGARQAGGALRVGALLTAVLLGGGCGPAPWTAPSPAPPAPSLTAPGPTSTPTATARPSPSPSRSPLPSPSASPSASPTLRPPSDALERGAEGPAVLALQQRLTELGYWLGVPDARFGLLTEQAVYAVQKAAGLARDGVVGPRTRRALAEGVRPHPRSSSGRVVEIDLERQLLLLVQDGRILSVLNTSTGSGRVYFVDGRARLAVTPRGHYEVYAQIDGLRRSELGLLWRPKYFHGGIAFHGYDSVPPYPASHGCVRVTDAAIDRIWAEGLVPIGTPVWVY